MSLDYTEEQEKKVQDYCTRNSLKESDVKEQIELKYADLVQTNQLVVEDDPETTHERRMARAIRAGQGYFRKYLRALSNAQPGMLICRHKAIGFDQFQINVAKRYIDENGMEKAIEDKYVNEAGNYLYTVGMNKGKVIGKPKSFTNITGYIVTTDAKGNEYYDLRCFSVSEDHIHEAIPMCQHSKIAFGEGKEPKKDYPHSDKNIFFYNGGMVNTNIETPYDEESFLEIVSTWNEVIEEMHFCNNLSELLDYRDNHCQILADKDNKHYYDFCIIPGVCAEIKDKDKPEYYNRQVYVTITDPVTYDMHDISSFVSYDEMQGLNIDEGMQGLFVLQAFKNKEEDQRINWHIGGFLPVDDMIDLEEFLSDNEEGE